MASNTQNSNTERENKPLHGVQSRPKGRKSMRLQPRRAANEKHACHDNGYGFLAVWLMFYSRAAPEPLHAVLQETTDKCRGERSTARRSITLFGWNRGENLSKRPCCWFVDAGTCRVISSRRGGKKLRWTWTFSLKSCEETSSRGMRRRRRWGKRDRNVSIFNRLVRMWGQLWDVSLCVLLLSLCSIVLWLLWCHKKRYDTMW